MNNIKLKSRMSQLKAMHEVIINKNDEGIYMTLLPKMMKDIMKSLTCLLNLFLKKDTEVKENSYEIQIFKKRYFY